MALASIIVLIGIIILAVLALKFLAGIIRAIISIALFIIAATVLVNWLTGTDPFGIIGLATSFLP